MSSRGFAASSGPRHVCDGEAAGRAEDMAQGKLVIETDMTGNTPTITLRFVRSKGFSSDAIVLREQTCMPFTPSHVECVTPEGTWLGQHSDGGMQARDAGYDHDDVVIMNDSRRCELFVELPCTKEQYGAFYAKATASIGEPYDWKAILGFAVSWHEHEKFHAICSAKMLLLLRACDYFRWPVVVPAHLVDPRDLLLMLSTHVKIDH
jgi:hypothetical protein